MIRMIPGDRGDHEDVCGRGRPTTSEVEVEVPTNEAKVLAAVKRARRGRGGAAIIVPETGPYGSGRSIVVEAPVAVNLRQERSSKQT